MNFIYDTLGAALAVAMLGVTVWFAWILRVWLDRPEVKAWVASYGVTTLGIGLYLLHPNQEPGDLYLTAFRNSLLMLGLGLQWVGCLRFAGQRGHASLAIAPVLLYLGVLVPLSTHLQGRPLAFSLGGIPFLLHGAWVLGRKLHPALARTGNIVVATQVVHAGFHAFRATMLAILWEKADLFLWIALGFLEAFPVLVTLAAAQWMLVEHRMESVDLRSSR